MNDDSPQPTAADISKPLVAERPSAETDWSAFVDAFGRPILEWFRQTGASDAEARELTAEILQDMGRAFTEVTKEPTLRFRAWLQFAAHAAWCRVMESQVEAVPEGTSSPKLDLLLSVEGHDTFLKALDSECTHLRRRDVLLRLQPQIDETDWGIYCQIVLEGKKPEDLAADLACKDLPLRAAVFRVQRRLNEELQRLEQLF